MACDGGLQTRQRKVLTPIRGHGSCPKEKSHYRFEEQSCNTQDCMGDEICIAQQDLIILIDGSGSLKKEGFDIIRDFAANLTGKYQAEYYGHSDMQVGVVLFGNGEVGPGGVIAPAIRVQELTSDMSAVKKAVEGLTWQKGMTNLAQGFAAAETILQAGRKDAQSAVLVLFDGKVSFKFQTEQEVNKLKESAMVYMAPIMENEKAKEMVEIKQWASQPWETNVEIIPGLQALKHNPEAYSSKLVAKFCPDSMSPSLQLAVEEKQEFMLIHETGYPSNACGRWYDEGFTNTKEDCALAARNRGYEGFSYGKHWQEGHCYSEAIKITKELYEKIKYDRTAPPCPNGRWLNNPFYDVYAIDIF